MAWARMDDSLDDHEHLWALLEHDRGLAAVGLLTLGFTWASRHRHPTRVADVPAHLPVRFNADHGVELAALLVQVGLWVACADGWKIVDAGPFKWGPMNGRRSYIPKWLRRLVYDRDEWRCSVCGSADDLTLDHIRPWSKGGLDTPCNLRTLCRSCNSSKGARA